jgi:hypothetical protein
MKGIVLIGGLTSVMRHLQDVCLQRAGDVGFELQQGSFDVPDKIGVGLIPLLTIRVASKQEGAAADLQLHNN